MTSFDSPLFVQVLGEQLAQQVFRLLGVGLRPRLFALGIGVRQEADAGGEDGIPCLTVWRDAESFDDSDLSCLLELEEVCDAAREAESPRELELVRPLVLAQIEGDASQADRVSFVSQPVRAFGRWLFLVLQVERRAYLDWPRLDERSVQPAGDRPAVALPVALLDSVAKGFLAAVVRELAAGTNPLFMLDWNPEDLIVSGARTFMLRPAHAAGLSDSLGAGGLFHNLSAISALPYEGREARGSLLIGQQDDPGVRAEILFESPVHVRDHRAFRKLLEISGESSLLLHGALSYGLGRADHGASKGELFRVIFNGNFDWSLALGDDVLMRVRHGQPRNPGQLLRAPDTAAALRRTFGEIPEQDEARLRGLLRAATKAGHGGLVVVSGRAAEEAKRLRDTAVSIEPTALKPETLRAAMDMDGAILLDTSGRCHAIGVILDGRRSVRERRDRGARFNAAVRYVDRKDSGAALAVVVSADKTVDVVTSPGG